MSISGHFLFPKLESRALLPIGGGALVFYRVKSALKWAFMKTKKKPFNSILHEKGATWSAF